MKFLGLVCTGLLLICAGVYGVCNFDEFDEFDYEEPGCDYLKALGCQAAALDRLKASGCNPNAVIPFLQCCTYVNAGECSEVEYEGFEDDIRNFNITMYSGTSNCNNCTDLQGQTTALEKCETDVLVGGQRLPELATVILNTGVTMCGQLKTITDCMSANAKDCPTLVDRVHDEVIRNQDVYRAVLKCSVTVPTAFPTLRPLLDLDAVDEAASATVDPGTGGDGNGGENGETVTTPSTGIPTYVIILLAIAGGMLLVAIVFGIGFAIERRRKDSLVRNEEYGDNQSMYSTSAKSYFNPPPRYYFGQNR